MPIGYTLHLFSVFSSPLKEKLKGRELAMFEDLLWTGDLPKIKSSLSVPGAGPTPRLGHQHPRMLRGPGGGASSSVFAGSASAIPHSQILLPADPKCPYVIHGWLNLRMRNQGNGGPIALHSKLTTAHAPNEKMQSLHTEEQGFTSSCLTLNRILHPRAKTNVQTDKQSTAEFIKWVSFKVQGREAVWGGAVCFMATPTAYGSS